MKTFDAFLKPKIKENMKFVLSDRFCDENENPVEWEIRSLTSAEGIALNKDVSENYTEQLAKCVAHSLVTPNLKDKELLDALSAREGHTILRPLDALKCLVNDAELARLMGVYLQYNNLGATFSEKVEEAKN